MNVVTERSLKQLITIYRKVNTEVQMAEYLMDKSLGDAMYVHKELSKLFSKINDDLNKQPNGKVVL